MNKQFRIFLLAAVTAFGLIVIGIGIWPIQKQLPANLGCVKFADFEASYGRIESNNGNIACIEGTVWSINNATRLGDIQIYFSASSQLNGDIPKEKVNLFSDTFLTNLSGKHIKIRGVLEVVRDSAYIRLQEPDAIKIIE